MLKLDLTRPELPVGGEAEHLVHDDRDVLDLMHGERKLVLDLVDLHCAIPCMLADGQDAPMREELLETKGGFQPVAEGFSAREQ